MPDPGNLDKIDHIVVLMLENRSFDHMLGYLSLEGGRDDVDGLREGMANSHGGHEYPVHHLESTHVPGADWDPDHSAQETDHQIGGGAMDGFAASYAHTLERREVPDPDPGLVMGYHNAGDLPVYDHLATEFCVCDAWHSSVPGATWPNRLYAMTGGADGSRDDKHTPPPLYDRRSFVRHLEAAGVRWRWYTYDVGTLRCADRRYLTSHHGHFAYVDRLKLRWEIGEIEELIVDTDSASFIEDATRGNLAPVSWIDPNFKDVNLAHADSNDDHPPSDVGAGQELVFNIYNAIASCPETWERTLLIVTYDEHGGFFDHVPPPEAPDDDPQMCRYGVRVPALVVSPWVAPRSVSHTCFDHTSIIKTILTRFCPEEIPDPQGIEGLLHWLQPGHPHYMGKRVAQANDLGALLSADAPRPAPDRTALVEWLAHRHAARGRKLATDPVVRPAELRGVSELQANIMSASAHLRAQGLPPHQP
jgi:phospholipase C